jgi:hypothetical protein
METIFNLDSSVITDPKDVEIINLLKADEIRRVNLFTSGLDLIELEQKFKRRM